MFESLGKRLSDIGNVAAKKTKNLGSTVSLTAKIEATKRELTGIYAQLGQQLYQNQQDAVPEEYAELFEKITRTEAVLEDYQAQRQVLRRVRPCPTCGADVPNDDEYCAKCGNHLGVVVEEEPEEADIFEDEDDIFEPEEGAADTTEDAPAEDAPAEDAPAEDAPAEDAPAEDAPAEE
ncbi:MAG: zinc ribbon domain-containing protein [Eubacterium sp.]|nr:zinc ribbon domain-containing protein [Eubacterium sp.]